MPINMTIPVGSGSSVGSDGNTYSGLVSDIADHLNRSDLTLKIPGFIRRVEERLNRILRVPEMEEIATLTVTDGVATLPTDSREIRHLYWNGDSDSELVPVSLATIRRDYPLGSYAARPLVYAVQGGDIVVAPLPGSIDGDLTLHYYQEIPAISTDSETNWLIVSHYSVYLYGALVMAEAFIWDDERLAALWKPAWDEAIGELIGQGVGKHHGGGPLYPRPIARPGPAS